MTIFPPASQGSSDLISSIKLDDFDVSWAGPAFDCPGNFLLGSEDGRVLFTDPEGVKLSPAAQASPSGEAINGAAVMPPWMGTSTRREVMVWTLGERKGEGTTRAQAPFGAHGLVAGLGGSFFAPCGRTGIMSLKPRRGPEQELTIYQSHSQSTYVYRLISVPGGKGNEIVACAARRDGIAAMEFKGQAHQHQMNTFKCKNVDVIDICPLSIQGYPTAAAALGKDGTIILFRNVLTDNKPVTIKYESIQGIAYRLLCARGHVFVLTSEGIHAIAGLIDSFTNEAKGNTVTPVLTVPMEAVDAYSVGDRWILIVMPEGVLRFDLEALAKITPKDLNYGEMRDLTATAMTPAWDRRESQTWSPVSAGTGSALVG